MPANEAIWTRGEPAVGQRAECERKVSHRDIELFTEISGDRNPLHYGEEALCYTMPMQRTDG